jgi:hypothetical protein
LLAGDARDQLEEEIREGKTEQHGSPKRLSLIAIQSISPPPPICLDRT